MRVPDEVLKCVAFLGITVQGEKDSAPPQDRYMGTAFFVGVPGTSDPDLRFGYLVTAKHVAERIEGDFWVRQNLKDGRAMKVAAERCWVHHPTDGRVDVAVMEWGITSEMDHLSIPLYSFLSSDDAFRKFGIGVGDEVFMTGVFPSSFGQKRNMPIVRKGNIAMIPEDKVPTRDLGRIDAYLIEARSFGRISGSPVFARQTVPIEHVVVKKDSDASPTRLTVQGIGLDAHYLLGLVHGHWHIDERDVNAAEYHSPESAPGINLGISIVIPAKQILETLNHPDLVQDREREEEMYLRNLSPTVADSGTNV